MSKGWYPVIDYDKCVGCMACNDMCRHGVYKPDTETGKPKVVYGTGCVHNSCRSQIAEALGKRLAPDVVIFMGCNVSCPNVPSQYAENWGLDDPSGQSDEVFVEAIRQIEKKVLQLKDKLEFE